MSGRSLLDAARDKGFTPGKKDLSELFQLLGSVASEVDAHAVAAALLRGPAALVFAEAAGLLTTACRPLRARLVALVAKVEGADPVLLRELLVPLLGDKDLKAASHAVTALGRFEDDPAAEAALLGALAAARPEQRRGLVRALAKVGGAATLAAFAALPPPLPLDRGGDAELARLIAQGKMILSRRGGRGQSSEVRGDLPLPAGTTVHFHCRRGLEAFVVEELQALGVLGRKVADGRVAAAWGVPLAVAWGARCFDELALAFPDRDPFAFLTGKKTRSLLSLLTRGPLRYRLDFGTDAERWALARRVSEADPDLINDPTQTTWELRRDGPTRSLELVPKRLADPRFTYRQAHVPASSHAPLAAALARLGGEEAHAVVWDPFCGAGTELVERAKRGGCRLLIGTDLDPEALSAARSNLAGAGYGEMSTLIAGDCLTVALPERPSLILSNPPLGRRVKRGEAEDLLSRLIARAGTLLPPGGRLVLVSPAPEASRAAATAAGLVIERDQSVDLGGFFARIQTFTARGAPR